MAILIFSKLGQKFNENRMEIQNTPRKFVPVPNKANQILLIESDHKSYVDSVLAKQRQNVAKEVLEAAVTDEEKKLAMDVAKEILDSDHE